MPHSLPSSPHFPPLHLSSRDKAGSESKFPRFCHFAARSSSAKKFDPHTRHLGAVLLPHVAVRPAVRQYDQPASPAPRRRLAAVAAVGGARSGRGLDKDAVVASGRAGAVRRLHLRYIGGVKLPVSAMSSPRCSGLKFSSVGAKCTPSREFHTYFLDHNIGQGKRRHRLQTGTLISRSRGSWRCLSKPRHQEGGKYGSQEAMQATASRGYQGSCAPVSSIVMDTWCHSGAATRAFRIHPWVRTHLGCERQKYTCVPARSRTEPK